MRNSNWPRNSIPNIKISIDDNGKFADMAYFFDFPPVLKEITRVRNQWRGGKIMSNSDVVDFIATGGNDPKEARKFWDNYNEGRKIAKKFHKPVNYVRPIIAAILSGEVTDEDYLTIFIEDPTHHYLPGDLLIENQIAYVTNRVRLVDVKKINTAGTKSIGSIKKHRESFLLFSKEHKGYKAIAQITGETETTVASAIKSYLKRMSDSFDMEFRIDAFKDYGLTFTTKSPWGT